MEVGEVSAVLTAMGDKRGIVQGESTENGSLSVNANHPDVDRSVKCEEEPHSNTV